MKSDYTYRPSAYAGEAARLEQQARVLEPFLEQELLVLKPVSGMRVLDVGCGTGAVTRKLARLVAPGEAYGVELHSPFLSSARELAQKEGLTNVRFEESNVNSLPYERGMFDMSYCRLVLMHMPDPVRTVGEMKRVTKTGGLVAASDYDDDTGVWYPETPVFRSLWARFAEFSKKHGSDRYIGRKLYEIFKQAGLSNVKIVPFTITLTRETPQLMRAAVDNLTTTLLNSREDMTREGFATQEDFDKAISERDMFLDHPGSFAMSSSLLAVGKSSS